MARCPELGSPKKGLGADDQIGDHALCSRPRELYCFPLGWTVSPAPLPSPREIAIRILFFFLVCFGRYRTTVDRLLGMKLVPSRRLVRRSVSYDFMNRQMVWHAFTVCPNITHASINRLPAKARSPNYREKNNNRNSLSFSFPSSPIANSDASPEQRWTP